MKTNNTVIIGSALTLGVLLAAIDHTRHPVPEAKQSDRLFSAVVSDADGSDASENPCSLKPPPCSL